MARPKTNFDPMREKLVRTACRLFSKQGFEETSISRIMREAGLTKAGMYHYFSSKEEILEEAINLYLKSGVERIRAASVGKGVEERLIIFIEGSVQRDEIMTSLEAMKGERNNSYAAYRIRERGIHENIPLLADILEEGMAAGIYRKAGDPRQIAGMLVLLAKALVERSLLPVPGPGEALARLEAYLDLVRTWLEPSESHFLRIKAAFEADALALAGEAG
jgi:AcrR family transcriptional regulator